MSLELRRPYAGDPAVLRERAIAVLAPLGFRVTSPDASTIHASGPRMNSNRQSPLLGAGVIRIAVADGHVTLTSDLSGMETLRRFILYFPVGLCLALGVIHGALFQSVQVIAIALLTAAPWLVLSPWMARRVEASTRDGLDALLGNLTL